MRESFKHSFPTPHSPSRKTVRCKRVALTTNGGLPSEAAVGLAAHGKHQWWTQTQSQTEAGENCLLQRLERI